MNTFYTFFAIAFSTFFLVSFSNDPPDGYTGAPGDSLCIECHIQTNPPLNGTITVLGFPAAITPLETYLLTVVNTNTVGDAVRGGFQMTILNSLNLKAGEMANPSANSAIANAAGRQYFEHHPAVEYGDTNVITWTVEWTAPDLPSGTPITWWVAGNIANGNFQNTGDRIVAEHRGGVVVLASNVESTLQKPTLYPNPGTDLIHVVLSDGLRPDGHCIFYNILGSKVAKAEIRQGTILAPDLPPGIYVLEIHLGDQMHAVRWSKQ